MINNLSWIGAVDHRISAAIVFFILLLLLSTGKKRRFFPLRAGLTLMVMVLASWGLRTLSDEMITMSVSPARSGKNLRFFPVLSSRNRKKNTMAAEIR